MSWHEFKKEEPEEKHLGDNVEDLLHGVGADKLAKLYEEVSGNDCGCNKRKEWLNNLHKRLKAWWARYF